MVIYAGRSVMGPKYLGDTSQVSHYHHLNGWGDLL